MTKSVPATAITDQPSGFVRILGLDLRSLAIFRVALGALVLVDMMGRIQSLRAHYTDEGVLPRAGAIELLQPWRWSVFLLNGTLAFQALLFLFTAVVAVALIVGYRTRLMTFLAWVMILSVQARNPLLLSGVDSLLRMVLFWSMFLPLGARWSVDRRWSRDAAPGDGSVAFSFASAGLLLQVAFMYWFTAILKESEVWLPDGTAMWYASGAGHVTRPLSAFLHDFPTLLHLLSYSALVVEVLGPLLLFAPLLFGPLRTLGVLSIMGLHTGIFLSMDVGIFPWVGSLTMLAFLPAWAWDTALPWLRARVPGIAALRRLPGMARGLAERLLGPARDRQPGRTRTLLPHPLANALAAASLLLVFGWNVMSVSSYSMPTQTHPAVYGLALYQKWNMFAPHPPLATQWYVVRGDLANGDEISLMAPLVYDDFSIVQALSWERPDDIVNDYYGDKYWRKYFDEIGEPGRIAERQQLAGYACRTWNADYEGEARLVRVEIYRLREDTLPEGQTPETVREYVAGHDCA